MAFRAASRFFAFADLAQIAFDDQIFPIARFRAETLFAFEHHGYEFRIRVLGVQKLFADDHRTYGKSGRILVNFALRQFVGVIAREGRAAFFVRIFRLFFLFLRNPFAGQ